MCVSPYSNVERKLLNLQFLKYVSLQVLDLIKYLDIFLSIKYPDVLNCPLSFVYMYFAPKINAFESIKFVWGSVELPLIKYLYIEDCYAL